MDERAVPKRGAQGSGERNGGQDIDGVLRIPASSSEHSGAGGACHSTASTAIPALLHVVGVQDPSAPKTRRRQWSQNLQTMAQTALNSVQIDGAPLSFIHYTSSKE